MENYYYAVIYDLLQAPIHDAARMTVLKEIKAKKIRLNSNLRQRITIDATEKDRAGGEEPSLYHLIKVRKRQSSRVIQEITDDDGMVQKTSLDILRAFADYFRRKFEPIPMGRQRIERLVPRGMRAIPPEYKEALTAPITEQELWTAISKGTTHLLPTIDKTNVNFNSFSGGKLTNNGYSSYGSANQLITSKPLFIKATC